GDQASWMLPFAIFGLLGAAALAFVRRRRPQGAGAGEEGLARNDPRLVTAIVFGGWFLVEAVVLSASKGIVHPYYTSALAPATGAAVAVGAAALVRLRMDRHAVLGIALLALAVIATVITQALLLHREHYLSWLT